MFGILVSPKETYAAVAARPSWMGVMAITLVIVAACQFYVLSSPDMQDAMFDQATSRGNVPGQAEAAIDTFISRLPYALAGATLILGPVVTAFMAWILRGIFSTLMGGTATFRQVYAIAAHSGVVSSLQGLISALLILVGARPTGNAAPGANLGVFVPMLEETSFVAMLMGSIDLILVWWLISLSIGLAVLYKRRTGGIATSLIGVYVVIAFIIAFFRSGS
jgi:hypothetical protein